MPQYIIELKLRNDRLKRGGGQNGATFQTTRSNKSAGDVGTWSFHSTDGPVAIKDGIEAIVATFGSVTFTD